MPTRGQSGGTGLDDGDPAADPVRAVQRVFYMWNAAVDLPRVGGANL
jgi:hypothetical protein